VIVYRSVGTGFKQNGAEDDQPKQDSAQLPPHSPVYGRRHAQVQITGKFF
jgi:hypothetical protein